MSARDSARSTFAQAGARMLGPAAGRGYEAGMPAAAAAAPAMDLSPPVRTDIPPDFVRFRNVEPRTREQRRALIDKETLEKQRLAQRSGGFHRYEAVPAGALTSMVAGAPGFQPEAGRFDTDTAGEERRERELDIAAERGRLERKREEQIAREEARWRAMEEQRRAEEERWSQLRETSTKAKANEGSVPYDPITLSYNDSKDGLRLRHADDSVRYRAAMRARNMQVRSTGSYNPITGETTSFIPVPDKPDMPSDLR